MRYTIYVIATIRYTNDTSLSNNIWEIKEKLQENPSLKWSIVKSVPAYSNTTKRCLLYLHKKLEIVDYPHADKLLNKRLLLYIYIYITRYI